MDRRKDEIGCPLFLFPAAVVALDLDSGRGGTVASVFQVCNVARQLHQKAVLSGSTVTFLARLGSREVSTADRDLTQRRVSRPH